MSKAKFYNKEETQYHLKICIEIERHLIKKGLIPHREWFIILDHEDQIIGEPKYEITMAQKERKERYRNPDLLWHDGKNLNILEVDGVIHYIKSENTYKRDQVYKNNNCKYFVIQTYELKDDKSKITNRSIEDIINDLDRKILELE